MRGPADGGTGSLRDSRGYSLNKGTCVASDVRASSGLGNEGRSAGCSNVYNSRVLRDEGGANTSEVSKGGIFLRLGGAPGPNAPANFVRKLGGWAEASHIAVGVTLRNREPCVETLGDHVGARGSNSGRAGRDWGWGTNGSSVRMDEMRCCAACARGLHGRRRGATCASGRLHGRRRAGRA